VGEIRNQKSEITTVAGCSLLIDDGLFAVAGTGTGDRARVRERCALLDRRAARGRCSRNYDVMLSQAGVRILLSRVVVRLRWKVRRTRFAGSEPKMAKGLGSCCRVLPSEQLNHSHTSFPVFLECLRTTKESTVCKIARKAERKVLEVLSARQATRYVFVHLRHLRVLNFTFD
jgi:hypothetical protein